MDTEFPETLLDFESMFSTDDACEQYLQRIRWPEGFVCPRCGSRNAWPSKRGLFICRSCEYQASVTAGTLFQDTRKPLRLWFRAMWYVTNQKHGASALGVQRVLGLGSYTTAWAWLHKLRRAMVRPGRDRLSGEVEVDETYVGGLRAGRGGRGHESKPLVIIAAQKDGRKIGRVRLARIADASAASLEGFLAQAVEVGSTVHSDGWQGYAGLPRLGYQHKISVVRGKEADAAVKLLPRVHLIASLLKRWLLGTHQGAVAETHLDYYLDEFTFRFNRRTSRSRGKLFFRLVDQAMALEPAPFKQLLGGKPPPSPLESTK